MQKESNGDEMMKNVNIQDEIEYCQNNEKIEDLGPRVGTSVGECNSLICLVFYPGTWKVCRSILSTRYSISCFDLWSLNHSSVGDSGSRNIVSIKVPQCLSSDSLNLSKDDPGELCSKGRVADWILCGNNTGRGCCSSSSASSSTSPSSWLSWSRGGLYAASS